MGARAWKFFDAGAKVPIGEVRWPLPAGGAGAWISEPGGLGAQDGVHACRPGDLCFWIRAELWEVELGDPVIERASRLEAPRGRLLRRVEGWDTAAARAYGESCALRARDLCAARLEALGRPAEAGLLRACAGVEPLQQAKLAPGSPREVDELFGYPVDAAGSTLGGLALAAGLVAAAAAEAAGAEGGHAAERARQSRWLVERLQLA